MVSQLLLYSMKSAMTLVMLYVPYIFMLQKEKFFRFNRRVLLGIIVVCLVLPLLNVSCLSVDDVPVVQSAHQQMVDVGIPVNMGKYSMESETSSLPAFEPARMPVSAHPATNISWFGVFAIVFFVGMIISVIVRSFQLGILSYAMKHKSLWEKTLENGIRICCRKGRFSPYSWMKTIVISEEDWRDGQHEIILHESGHIFARHSYDMLLLMVCQAVQWYNPFVWVMSRSLAEVHEYEADQYVLEQGVSSSEYMMLLLKKVSGEQKYSFVNGFNKNSIKQRILMMKETSKSSWRRMKAIYVLPVCLVVMCAFATQKVPIFEYIDKEGNVQPATKAELPTVEASAEEDEMLEDSTEQETDDIAAEGTEDSTSVQPVYATEGVTYVKNLPLNTNKSISYKGIYMQQLQGETHVVCVGTCESDDQEFTIGGDKTYIEDTETGDYYKVRRSLTPSCWGSFHVRGMKGKSFAITLVFPPLPDSVKQVRFWHLCSWMDFDNVIMNVEDIRQ